MKDSPSHKTADFIPIVWTECIRQYIMGLITLGILPADTDVEAYLKVWLETDFDEE